ncbi:MAG: hypothetical protein R2734_02745 [Nocardioides sp.]
MRAAWQVLLREEALFPARESRRPGLRHRKPDPAPGRAGYAVDGLDVSPAMVARARAKVADRADVTAAWRRRRPGALARGVRRRAVPARVVGAARSRGRPAGG